MPHYIQQVWWSDHCKKLQPLQKKHSSNHLSVHQWVRSAIRDPKPPTSPMGFLYMFFFSRLFPLRESVWGCGPVSYSQFPLTKLKLPPPPCAVLLVLYIHSYIYTHTHIYVYMYIYIHIHTHTYIYIHIYIYIYTCVWTSILYIYVHIDMCIYIYNYKRCDLYYSNLIWNRKKKQASASASRQKRTAAPPTATAATVITAAAAVYHDRVGVSCTGCEVSLPVPPQRQLGHGAQPTQSPRTPLSSSSNQ